MAKTKDNLLEEQQKKNEELDAEYQETIGRIHDAVRDMYSKVKFDNKEHVYTRISDGKFLQGVSSISSIVPKDWLAPWASKETCKYLGLEADDENRASEMKAKIACSTIAQYLEILKEAKNARLKKSKQALLDGTEGHEFCERYVKSKMGKGTFTMPQESDMLYRPIKQFVDWAEENIMVWILSEAIVSDVENEFSGTLDGLAMLKDGSVAVIDFKFAAHVSEDYFLQATGYCIPFERYGIKIDKRIIIRLPKTETQQVWDKTTRSYNEVPNDMEVVLVDTDYEFDKEVFLASIKMKKWINIHTNK